MKRPVLDPGFDPRIADWLEDDPDHAPDAVLETVLAAFPSIPQRRALHAPWRFRPMSQTIRLVAALVAIAIAAVGGSMLFLRGNPPPVPLATPSPSQPTVSPSATPSASNGPSSKPAASWPSAPSLTTSYPSERYGYTIRIGADWKVTSGAGFWLGPDNSPPDVDQFDIAGSDTELTVSSQALAPGQTYDQFLQAFHQFAVEQGSLAGCDGGPVATWPSIQIGSGTGLTNTGCNRREAVILVGRRVYAFEWGHSTFDPNQHVPDRWFERTLAGVVFDPAAALNPSPGPS